MDLTYILATILQILAALFMAFIWAAFMRKLDIFKPEKWWKIAVAFGVGCLTPFPILLLHELVPAFGVQPSELGSTFKFFILNVGMVEEGSKFLGFLLVFLIFKKWFDEDINFLVYASLVGLGFATVENCLYFFEYGIHLVYIRGLMCAVGHMTGTALIASMLCIGLRKKSIYVLALPFIGLLIAGVLHGLYDSFMSIHAGLLGVFFSIYIFMLEVEIWAQYSNNFLNQSKFYKNNIAVDRDTLQKFLIAAFIIAGIVQLIGLIIKEGWAAGLVANFIMLLIEGMITVVLVARITRYTVVPGHWKKIYPYLPFERRRTVPFYKPSPMTPGPMGGQGAFAFSIRGDEFNEYPFTTRINKLINLVPFKTKKYDDDGVYQCWIIEKVFLGKNKELYYLCELAGEYFNIPNAHPKYFLIKPKLAGTKYVQKWPIIGVISLPSQTDIKDIQIQEASFVRWSLFKDEEKEHFSQTWKEMIF